MAEFTVITKLEVEINDRQAIHKRTEFMLKPGDDIDSKMYIENDLPNKLGCHTVTNVLIQGLILNIHLCQKKGFKQDAEHLNYIIQELRRGLKMNSKIGSGIFK